MRVLLFCLIALTGLAIADPPRLAFVRGDGVWVANFDGSEPKYLYGGTAPDLSPDGRVATFVTDDALMKGDTRRLAVATLPEGKVTVLKTPSKNCQAPALSPDATRIAYGSFNGAHWNVALVRTDGTDFRVLRLEGYSPCWAPDGNSVYVNDLETIVQLDLTGQVLHQWKIDSLIPKWSMNSGTVLDVSPDGRTLLLDLVTGQEPKTTSAIWRLNLHTGQALRLVDGFTPRWVSPTDFVYMAEKKGKRSLYRMGPKGGTLLLQEADSPGV